MIGDRREKNLVTKGMTLVTEGKTLVTKGTKDQEGGSGALCSPQGLGLKGP